MQKHAHILSITIWNIKLLHVLVKAAACEESMHDNKSGAKINQDKQCVHVMHLSPMSSKLLFSTTVPRSENDLQKISEPWVLQNNTQKFIELLVTLASDGLTVWAPQA